MPSIFSRIVAGEIPAHKIAETDDYLAFLDVMPTTTGHTLVIPKKEVDYLFDLDDELYLGLMGFAKKVAPAIEKAIPCQRIGVGGGGTGSTPRPRPSDTAQLNGRHGFQP